MDARTMIGMNQESEPIPECRSLVYSKAPLFRV